MKSGADDGTRTRDLLITNQLLYQLSYVGDAGKLSAKSPPWQDQRRVPVLPRTQHRRILPD